MRVPYSRKEKNDFIALVEDCKGQIYVPAGINPKTGKKTLAKKIGSPWKYTACGKQSLERCANKYTWVARYLELAKNQKLLKTYVMGIQKRLRYGVIHPSFLQHGTTSGRYSSKLPNFQNLPRDDKRVKSCIVARPGKVFVGADYAQLEPRVFASVSQDPTLMGCFESGQDFYSVVGAPIFGKTSCSLVKSDPNSFAKKYPELRDKSKVIALATPYGRTAFQQAAVMKISQAESQELIDRYFAAYPRVELMMLESHEQAKAKGEVHTLFGRPRRIPAALEIKATYGNASHGELPYAIRGLLNLGMNHRVQGTAASIMNRAAIACWKMIKILAEEDAKWAEVKIVLQVHDQLILEGPEELGEAMVIVLKDSMENTTILPGVKLVADPTISKDLAGQK
jgi:DNA polymerase I